MARSVQVTSALFNSPQFTVCRLLRLRRAWLPFSPRLAEAKTHLDLFTEFRNLTNGLQTPAGNALIGALTQYGLDGIGVAEKEQMRDLVLRGGPWSREEQIKILDYCESDVAALARLLPAMLPRIDLPRAIYRGRYMAAAASMEFTGVPINLPLLIKLRERWTAIQEQLIAKIDADYGVYEGRTFKADRFESWLVQRRLSWPRLDSGRLDLSDDTFKEMAQGSTVADQIARTATCSFWNAFERFSRRP